MEAKMELSAVSATWKLQLKVCIICTAVLHSRIMVAAFTMYAQPRAHIAFKAKIKVRIGTPISHELSQDEIIETWGKQVASMCHYHFIDTESENSEAQDQKDFANA
mgnify:CR=1 FL=1